MKYTAALGALLVTNWLLWSGHFDNAFLLGLGGLSCIGCLWLGRRMQIVDEEGAPAQLGIRPFTRYAPWLLREIVVSNIDVAKLIVTTPLKLARNMIMVTSSQKTEIGQVIFANSITLTPGTVSVDIDEDQISVHALNLAGAEEDLSGEMDERVSRLEKQRKP